MCKHIDTLEQKRNALVALRESLYTVGLIVIGEALNEELSRHENFYEWLSEEFTEQGCKVCRDLAYTAPEFVSEEEIAWEHSLSRHLTLWGKPAPEEPAPWEVELLALAKKYK